MARGLNDPLPPLRSGLEAVPIEKEGMPYFLLRDLEDLTQEGVGVSAGGMLVASLLDGTRTAVQVASLFAKSTGQKLEAEEILTLVEGLDKSLMLETPEVGKLRAKALKEFRESPKRPSSFAGLSYPEEPLQLGAMLGGYFSDPKGPGKDVNRDGKAEPPLGLVAPHIDFPRGGPAYAWAFQALSESRPPDLIVALGVAHMSPDSPWVLTPKTYETPYGSMRVDQGLYDDFKSALWYDPLADEQVHRNEHSLEFQAVWLRYLWRDATPPWLPILCSSFERFSPDKAPSSVATVEKAITEIGAKLRERAKKGQRILILAGIDLAHVGPRFGDDLEITPELEKKIEGEDRKSLEHAVKLEADEFYLSVVAGGHWRKVCGLSTLYTSLRLIRAMGGEPAPGKLLAYGQAPDPAGGIVSFASAIFPRK